MMAQSCESALDTSATFVTLFNDGHHLYGWLQTFEIGFIFFIGQNADILVW